MKRRDRSAEFEVADTAHRVAVLLQAGITPDRAWGYIGESRNSAAASIHELIREGMRTSDAIAQQGTSWIPIANAWRIATEVGAPLGETLRSIASAVRDASESADDVEVALAEPAMTARIMAWLPLAGLLLGLAMGFDTAAILVTNPLGMIAAGFGIGLILLSRTWTKRLVARARDLPASPGLHQELTAIALSGGASIPRATALVDECGTDADAAATLRVLELSQRAGVPAVALLRQDATDERRRTRTDARVRAARLGGALLLPLGVCTLPAFMLLGVVPLLLSVILTTQVVW